jgi:integrase
VCVGYEVRMGETKTGLHRDVDLDPGTSAILKSWRKRQIAERWKWKELWTDTGLVFTQEDGTGWHPNRITKLFGNAIAKVQKDQEKEAERIKDGAAKILPRIRLHDLRHGAASLALQNGEPIVVVSKRLGHQSAKMTYDVYGHLMPGASRETANRMGALIFGSR